MKRDVLLCLNLRRAYATAQCAARVEQIAACLDASRKSAALVVHVHHLWHAQFDHVAALPPLAPRASEAVFISTRLADLLPLRLPPIRSVLIVGGVYTYSGLAAASVARRHGIEAWLGLDAVLDRAATPDTLQDRRTLLGICKGRLLNQTRPTQEIGNIIPWPLTHHALRRRR